MAKAIATTPGRGRKHCPGCNKYPGVRSKTCPGCNHVFAAKPKTAQIKIRVHPAKEKKVVKGSKLKEPKGEYDGLRQSVILIPAGKCPVELKEASIPAISKWMADVREARRDRNEYLSDEALCYWTREFFPMYVKNEEGKYIKSNLGDKVRAIINKLGKEST